jgi:hypothetical protein
MEQNIEILQSYGLSFDELMTFLMEREEAIDQARAYETEHYILIGIDKKQGGIKNGDDAEMLRLQEEE